MAKHGLRAASVWKRALRVSASISIVPGAAYPAMAQVTPPAPTADQQNSSGGAIADIIVTAQKRSENLQKVPVAVSAFTAETLTANNVTGLSDLVSVTPTLRFSFAAPSGSPFLRGVGSDQTFPGAEAEVQTYIDGVYYGSGAAAFTKFNNIRSVEVDKGPQGTLFGRNATSGVIQIVTRDPSHDSSVDASVGYGNFNLREADLYATTGISEKLAGDIAVHFEDRDGWGRNVTLNRDAFASKSIGIRSKWLFQASDDTRLTLIGDYSRNESDLGTAYVVVTAPWRPSLTAPIPQYLGDFTTAGDTRSYGVIKQYGVSLKIETKISDLSLVSISAYRRTDTDGYIDADATATPILAALDARKEQQASQEFQLLSPSGGRLQWILGAYLYYNKSSADPARLFGTTFAFTGADSIDNFSTMKTNSIAGFGQATYDIAPTTHVTAGLRYTYDRREQEANVVFNYPPPAGPGAPPAFFGLGVNNYPNASFGALTGKFTIAQDFSDHVMGYIGYSRGFKSGTFNNLIVLSNPGPALQPEHLDAFEGGLKSDLFNRHVRLNLATFYYRYSNLQINVFQNFNIALQNAASSQIYGIDGDAQVVLARDTRLNAGFGLLHARYKSFTNAPLYTVNPINSFNPANFGYGGVIIGQTDASGNRLPQAPSFSANIGLSQKIRTDTGDFDLNAAVNYQSRVYFTPDNLYSQRRYATVSVSAKWTSANGRWDAMLWARNVTDFRSYATETISAFLVAGVPNEPRSFGGRVGVHF